jgi:hypothetical protein
MFKKMFKAMFKFLFIISMLLPTVSANEINLIALVDFNFTKSNIAEIEQADNLDFDDPSLLYPSLVQFQSCNYINLSYYSSFILQYYFHNFHSRAPPPFIFHHTLIA